MALRIQQKEMVGSPEGLRLGPLDQSWDWSLAGAGELPDNAQTVEASPLLLLAHQPSCPSLEKVCRNGSGSRRKRAGFELRKWR